MVLVPVSCTVSMCVAVCSRCRWQKCSAFALIGLVELAFIAALCVCVCVCVCLCVCVYVCVYQGLDNVHKQRVAEVLSEPEAREKQRSRESLTSDTVKYESGPDGGEEVSMSVEWNGVSTVHSPRHVTESLQTKFRHVYMTNCLDLSGQKPHTKSSGLVEIDK